VIVLTTSAGIMDHEEARRKKTGGKVRKLTAHTHTQPCWLAGVVAWRVEAAAPLSRAGVTEAGVTLCAGALAWAGGALGGRRSLAGARLLRARTYAAAARMPATARMPAGASSPAEQRARLPLLPAPATPCGAVRGCLARVRFIQPPPPQP
jgi:hypothetical protein